MRHQDAFVVPPQLFRREPTDALNEAAFDLPHVDGRIERATDVVQDVDAKQSIFARQRVDRHLGHCGAIAEIIERYPAPGFAIVSDLRCPVVAGRR